MSSKQKVNSKSKEKLVQYRRCWLESKLQGVNCRYSKTLIAFQRHVDDIVGKTMKAANKLLKEKNDEVFLQDVLEIGVALEKCLDQLFDIQFTSCANETDLFVDSDEKNTSTCVRYSPENGDENSKHNLTMEKTMCTSELDFSLELCSTSTSSDCESESFQSAKSYPDQCSSKNMSQSSTNIDAWKQEDVISACADSNKSSLLENDFSSSGENQDTLLECTNQPDESIVEEKVEADPGKNVPVMAPTNFPENALYSETGHNGDFSLFQLHNVKCGEEVELTISDIESPSMFSVQINDFRDQLHDMELELNGFYSQQWTRRLVFDAAPEVGTICVALFPVDRCWYRVRISKVVNPDLVEVLYIDYGNRSELDRCNIRTLSEDLAKVPPMSINCSLHGIQPLLSSNAVDGKTCTGEWSMASIEWFDKCVYGKHFIGIFSFSEGNSSTFSVSLFSPTTAENDQKVLWSVADLMVCVGLACYCQKPFTSVAELSKVPNQQKIRNSPNKINDADVKNNEFENQQLFTANLDQATKHVAVAKSDPTDKEIFPAEVAVANTNDQDSSLASDHTHIMTDIQRTVQNSSSSCDVFEASKSDKSTMSSWDPMKQEYYSRRNNYFTDTDNACVVVENFNPEKREVCKFFAKGCCWREEYCKYSHISPNSDVLYCYEVFSYASLEDIALIPGETIVIKIAKVDRDVNMHAQLLWTANTSMKYGNMSLQLKSLTDDMKSYYANNKKRLQIQNPPSCGEMFVVIHYQIYCRATVSQPSTCNKDTVMVKMYLIDYGISEWVNVSTLLPMSQAFMHLPKQAIICSIDWINSNEKPVRTHTYLARIGAISSPIVDSPVSISLLAEVSQSEISTF